MIRIANRLVLWGAVLAVVIATAAPAMADAGSYITSIQKTGASGQRYAWSPGGC